MRTTNTLKYCCSLLCLTAIGLPAASAQPAQPPSASTSGVALNAPPTTPENLLADATVHKFATYTIKTPGGWQRKEDPIVALHVLPPDAKLLPNLKAAVVRLPPPFTMMDSVTQSKKAYASIWSIESESNVKVGSLDAVRLVLTQDLGVVKSKQLKYFIAGDQQVIIVTAQSTAETFQSHMPLFEAIAQSMKPAP